MSAQKKTRSDSILGTLPEDRQAEIAEHARSHSLADTVAWLASYGIRISRSSLSDWLSAWVLRTQFRIAEQDTLQFMELLQRRQPNMPESEMQSWASEYFQMQAIKKDDPETFLAFATARHKARMDDLKLKQKEVSLQHDERRIKLLEQKAAQADAAKEVVASKLTPEQQQNRLKEIFGMPT
jgi:hypothetical protein